MKILSKLWQYILNILVLIDQALNTVLFFGDPHETMSSRIGKYATKGFKWACVICRFLDWVDKRHCATSIEPAVGSKDVIT